MEHQTANKTNQADTQHQPASGAKPISRAPEPTYPFQELQHQLGNRALGRRIQAKLTVSHPQDAYEQEADRVADQVMRMPDPQIQRKCSGCEEEERVQEAAVPQIQRKCGACAEEEVRRAMTAEEEKKEEEPVQRKAAGEANEVDADLERGISNCRGGGQPLPAAERSFFEPRFGQSFDKVRIHTGEAADRAAKSINAQAFTLGNNIAFARSANDFGSASGRRLMAHELTHTLQQSAGSSNAVQRGSAGIFGGKCCLSAPRVEWALVGAGVWKKLEQGNCTGTTEDCDGMTCGGGFYHVDNGQSGTCSTPRTDDATFAPRRWTPSAAGASGTSPTAEGSTGGETPPNYVYDAAATAACPGGVRTISVDFVTLSGATTSPATEIASANRLYSGCCVQFVTGATPPAESLATTQSWLGGDTDLNASGITCPTPTTEEKSMFDKAEAAHHLSSRMRVFLVSTFSGYTGAGYSRPPFCSGGYVNHIILSNSVSGSINPLAHEFGHILLDSGAHTTSPDFMAPAGGTVISPTDCATAYSNA